MAAELDFGEIPASTPFYTEFTSFTPVIKQPGNIALSVDQITGYTIIGNLCYVRFGVLISGTGTAGNNVFLDIADSGLPVHVSKSFYNRFGSFHMWDASAGVRRIGMNEPNTAGTSGSFGFVVDGGGGNYLGISPSIGLASGDQMCGCGWYEIQGRL